MEWQSSSAPPTPSFKRPGVRKDITTLWVHPHKRTHLPKTGTVCRIQNQTTKGTQSTWSKEVHRDSVRLLKNQYNQKLT